MGQNEVGIPWVGSVQGRPRLWYTEATSEVEKGWAEGKRDAQGGGAGAGRQEA